MTIFYGKDYWHVGYIEQDMGYGPLPVLGITYDMVHVRASKAGADFTVKVVHSDGWRDLGDGYYAMLFSGADDLNTLGQYFCEMTIPSMSLITRYLFDVDPEPFALTVEAPICVVTGNIVDIGGNPLALNTLHFRPRNVPGVAGSSLVASGHIVTSTDAFGNFSVKLLREAIVLVEIENAGIRHIITVPDQPTAELLDLLPPIPLPIP